MKTLMKGQKSKNLTIIDEIPIVKIIVNKNTNKKIRKLYIKVKCDCGTEFYTSKWNFITPHKYFSCWKCAMKRNGVRQQGSGNPIWKGCGRIPATHFGHIKRCAKGRGIVFDITIEYVSQIFEAQNGKCAYTGVDLYFKKFNNEKSETTASLDRINSDLGYIFGNVQWVDKDINNWKSDYSHDEFIDLCKRVVEYDAINNLLRK